MPYAPTVNDRSGEILGQSTVGAANTKLAGIEALANGIQSGASSAAGGFSEGMTHWQDQARKYDAVAGRVDALSKIGPQYGITEEDLANLTSEKNPDKAAGKLLLYEDLLNNRIQDQRAQQQIDRNLDYQREKAAIWAQPAPGVDQQGPSIYTPNSFPAGINY